MEKPTQIAKDTAKGFYDIKVRFSLATVVGMSC